MYSRAQTVTDLVTKLKTGSGRPTTAQTAENVECIAKD